MTPENGPYAGIAVCACPGSGTCAEAANASRAVGQPDGQSVDMMGCDVLQLTFTSGTLVPVREVPDLAIHVAASAGSARIEASEDGLAFVDVGFFGTHAYPNLPAQCRVEVAGGRLLVYIDRCNYLSSIRAVRVQRETGAGGALQVDAVEALSFCATGEPCNGS